MYKKILLSSLSLVLMVLSAGFVLAEDPVACTLDAKICPDGSSVGRIGPNCEFAACPSDTKSLSLRIEPNKITEAGEQITAFFNDIGADYYVIGALCKDVVKIQRKGVPDLCIEGEKIYPTGKDVLRVGNMYPSTSKDTSFFVTVDAFSGNEIIQTDRQSVEVKVFENNKNSDLYKKPGESFSIEQSFSNLDAGTKTAAVLFRSASDYHVISKSIAGKDAITGIIPKDISSGKTYKLYVCANTKPITCESRGSVIIDKNDSGKDKNSRIEIKSPNGGEIWLFGHEYKIKWDSKNVSGDIEIRIDPEFGRFTCRLGVVPASKGVFSVKFDQKIVNDEDKNVGTEEGAPCWEDSLKVIEGRYKLFLWQGDGTIQNTIDDWGDGYFTIKQDPRNIKIKPFIKPTDSNYSTKVRPPVSMTRHWYTEGFSSGADFFFVLKNRDGRYSLLRNKELTIAEKQGSGGIYWSSIVEVPADKFKKESEYQIYICGKENKKLECEKSMSIILSDEGKG